MKTTSFFVAFFSLFFIACLTHYDGKVILKVTISNGPFIDTIFLTDYNQSVSVALASDDEGIFKDTLNLKEGLYYLDFGLEYTTVYLKNGYDLAIHIGDFDVFDESIRASGKGKKVNNFLFEQLLEKEATFDDVSALEPDEFERSKQHFLESQQKKLNKLSLISFKISDVLKEKLTDEIEEFDLYYQQLYSFKQSTDTIKTAPNFSGKDVTGKVFSLSDFRGQLVYIDVWTSWCTPCIKEVPHFQQLISDYMHDDIQFVGISLDCPEHIDNWKEALLEHQLNGIQLIADSCFESSIAQDYFINSIPRFILVDENGGVIDIDAPRPSSSEIRTLIDRHLQPS